MCWISLHLAFRKKVVTMNEMAHMLSRQMSLYRSSKLPFGDEEQGSCVCNVSISDAMENYDSWLRKQRLRNTPSKPTGKYPSSHFASLLKPPPPPQRQKHGKYTTQMKLPWLVCWQKKLYCSFKMYSLKETKEDFLSKSHFSCKNKMKWVTWIWMCLWMKWPFSHFFWSIISFLLVLTKVSFHWRLLHAIWDLCVFLYVCFGLCVCAWAFAGGTWSKNSKKKTAKIKSIYFALLHFI